MADFKKIIFVLAIKMSILVLASEIIDGANSDDLIFAHVVRVLFEYSSRLF